MTKTEEIVCEIRALASHYPRRQLAPEDFAQWLDDYAGDLAQFTGADVRLACAAWRRSDAKKMPTPGELIGQCRLLAPVLTKPENVEVEKFKRLSDQMAEHAELADQANLEAAKLWRRLPETKAGAPPSWVNFRTSLPAGWAALRLKEQNHRAEVRRLRELMKAGQFSEHTA